VQAFLESALIVAIAEIGDRTQLLSFVLASRFRRPVPILFGILIATIVNHFIAGYVGRWVALLLSETLLRWALGVSFLAMALWALRPDKLEEGDTAPIGSHGAFVATLIGFFIAEIGDKTQIATAALAARFEDLAPVVLGTTVGMMAANLPVVLFGHFASDRFDPRWARYVAAALLAAQGIFALVGVTAF
jgi:putative Ca2+/H+ antiporter (TMEM165/GDT1 family)